MEIPIYVGLSTVQSLAIFLIFVFGIKIMKEKEVAPMARKIRISYWILIGISSIPMLLPESTITPKGDHWESLWLLILAAAYAELLAKFLVPRMKKKEMEKEML